MDDNNIPNIVSYNIDPNHFDNNFQGKLYNSLQYFTCEYTISPKEYKSP